MTETFCRKLSENQDIAIKIKDVATENMEMAVKMMKMLDTDEQYMKKILAKREFKNKKDEHVKDELSEALEYLTKDSRIVNKELESFLFRISEHKKPRKDECPFLKQVWEGEIYGDKYYDGLKELLKELELVNKVLSKGNESAILEHHKSFFTTNVELEKKPPTKPVTIEEEESEEETEDSSEGSDKEEEVVKVIKTKTPLKKSKGK